MVFTKKQTLITSRTKHSATYERLPEGDQGHCHTPRPKAASYTQLKEEIRQTFIIWTDVVIHTTEHHLVLERKTLTPGPAKTWASLEDSA